MLVWGAVTRRGCDWRVRIGVHTTLRCSQLITGCSPHSCARRHSKEALPNFGPKGALGVGKFVGALFCLCGSGAREIPRSMFIQQGLNSRGSVQEEPHTLTQASQFFDSGHGVNTSHFISHQAQSVRIIEPGRRGYSRKAKDALIV